MEWGGGSRRVGRDLATEQPPRWWPHRELLKEQSSSSLATPEIPLPGTVGVSLDHTLDSPGSYLFLPDGSSDIQAPSQTNQIRRVKLEGCTAYPGGGCPSSQGRVWGNGPALSCLQGPSQPASRTRMSGWVFYLRTLSSPSPLCP